MGISKKFAEKHGISFFKSPPNSSRPEIEKINLATSYKTIVPPGLQIFGFHPSPPPPATHVITHFSCGYRNQKKRNW